MNTIFGFHDEYQFLSNFYPSPITYHGIHYPNVENAYQAAKFIYMKPHEVAMILGDEIMRDYHLDPNDDQMIPHFFAQLKPNKAKRWGRKLPMIAHWDDMKVTIMQELIWLKFTQNPFLKKKLLDTKDATIIEQNYWHDNIWGNCDCPRCTQIPGENLLGKILMETRRKLQNT